VSRKVSPRASRKSKTERLIRSVFLLTLSLFRIVLFLDVKIKEALNEVKSDEKESLPGLVEVSS